MKTVFTAVLTATNLVSLASIAWLYTRLREQKKSTHFWMTRSGRQSRTIKDLNKTLDAYRADRDSLSYKLDVLVEQAEAIERRLNGRIQLMKARIKNGATNV